MNHALRSTFASATLLALAVAASPAWAQNVARGKQLFDDTAGASGINTFTSSCAGCHANSVQNRRIAVGGSATAQIEPDAAYTAIVKAIGSVSQMTQFNALDPEDVRDLAAYIADTAHVDKTTLTFTSTGVNTPAAAQAVTLKSPTLPFAQLTIRKIEIAGNNLGNFNRTVNCDNKAFAAGESCTFTVTYDPRNNERSNPVLTLTLRDGTGADYTRRVQLEGSIAGTTPTTPTTPTAPAAESDSGGGASGAGLLALLAAATGVLGLRRRRA